MTSHDAMVMFRGISVTLARVILTSYSQSQLIAHNKCVDLAPAIGAHAPPHIVHTHLDSSFIWEIAPGQSNTVLLALSLLCCRTKALRTNPSRTSWQLTIAADAIGRGTFLIARIVQGTLGQGRRVYAARKVLEIASVCQRVVAPITDNCSHC